MRVGKQPSAGLRSNGVPSAQPDSRVQGAHRISTAGSLLPESHCRLGRVLTTRLAPGQGPTEALGQP